MLIIVCFAVFWVLFFIVHWTLITLCVIAGLVFLFLLNGIVIEIQDRMNPR